MSFKNHTPGINHVGEYQLSGHLIPIDGSSNIVKLKFVASSITFTESGGTFTVYDGEHNASTAVAVSAPCRIKGKFLTFKTTKDAVVEITNIPSGSYVQPLYTEITGS
tara:strand:+ start:1881 stop:2204 length:324 start_codon:yes stop_codon:yes gene_type:complete